MGLDNYLARIKSAGIYRFVWDKSVIPSTTAEALRLVVGYSEKGPFNTPVYIEKVSDFYNIFGNTNKKLERKGIYFHRMAIQALAGGPILALNLKPFTTEDDEDGKKIAEKVEYLNFNPANMLKYEGLIPKTTPVVNMYDTNRFWYLDADQIPNKVLPSKDYITITHTDTKDRSCSIMMRPNNSSNYNMTIRDWYLTVAEEEMPSYLEPIQYELVSKYFADLYVFRGEFTPELVKEGGPFGNYVTQYENGVVTGQKWNGYFKCLYPDATEANNVILPAEGEDQITYAKQTDKQIIDDNNYPYAVNYFGESLLGTELWKWKNGDSIVYSTNESPLLVYNGDFTPKVLLTKTVEVDQENNTIQIPYIISNEKYTFAEGTKDSTGKDISGEDVYTWDIDSNNEYAEAEDAQVIYTSTLNPSQYAIGEVDENGIVTLEVDENGNIIWKECAAYDMTQDWVECNNDYDLGEPLIVINTDYENAYGEKVDALEVLAADSTSNFIQSYTGCLLPYFKDGMGNYVSLDILFNLDHDSHNMLMKMNEHLLEEEADKANAKEALEKILYCSDVYKETYTYVDVENVRDSEKENYKVYESIPDLSIFTQDVLQSLMNDPDYNRIMVNDVCYKLVHNNPVGLDANNEEYTIYLTPLYLKGYTYNTIQNNDKDIILQNKILKVLEDKGIRTALTNRVDVDYHYIVDTFKSYVYSNCKSKISMIAKEKDNAFALLNFPPMTDFISSNKFTTNKKFDIGKLASARYGFSLPSENEGASHCAFFTNVIFSDGTLKSIIPSAAIVSNNFIKKYDGNLKPYHIIAGPNRGLVAYSGMIGPDYNYGRSDLDVLEPLGVNAIIYVPRKGTYINSNQTAKQTPVSALSKVHIRELVIYIQDEIENMLQNYQWELNTQTLRDTIKTNADYLLGKIMSDGGIYAYSTICDSSNNTPEIIDNEMLVLDIAIEPARGAGKMVQQLTIHKTGGITSTAN